MKRHLVAGLIRLYPSRWRADYGEELADVLLRRPLGFGAVANVAANALWQQLRLQEPWLLMGVPVLLWVVMRWIELLTHPVYIAREGGGSLSVAVGLLFAVGFWTTLRSGGCGGRAAMKLSMLATLPFVVVGLLVLAQYVRVVPGPGGGVGFRLDGPSTYPYGVDIIGRFVFDPIVAIPICGLIGWCGGLTGRLARRLRRA
jgi:hypothetical protein